MTLLSYFETEMLTTSKHLRRYTIRRYTLHSYLAMAVFLP
jgi:hypothetical protein